MRPAGYQRPVEHPHKLDTGDKMWPESRVIVTGWVSEQSSKLVRWDLRNASSVCRVNLVNSENETVSRSCVIFFNCVLLLLSHRKGWFIRYAGLRFPSHTPDALVQTVGTV